MDNWLDELERKKKEESERREASVNEDLRESAAAKEAKDRMYESVKHRVEPIFAKLEALVERANNNDFHLIVVRGDYEHTLNIYRYDAESTLVDVVHGQLKMKKQMFRAKGTEEHLTGVAELTFYPEPTGLKIWFTEARMHIGWKKGKWYCKWEFPGVCKFHECIGTVPFDAFTEEKMLELVKWIARGNEPIPHFQNVIPYKGWQSSESQSKGCLLNPWTYIILLGLLLLYLYVRSQT